MRSQALGRCVGNTRDLEELGGSRVVLHSDDERPDGLHNGEGRAGHGFGAGALCRIQSRLYSECNYCDAVASMEVWLRELACCVSSDVPMSLKAVLRAAVKLPL